MGERKEHTRDAKITFTTYPEIREWIDKKRGLERLSNYLHRKLVNEYNEKIQHRFPDQVLPIWNPEDEEDEE